MTREVVVATRSAAKLREISAIASHYRKVKLVPADAVIGRAPAEDALEMFDTFRENALAKARYFACLTELPVLAEDSGLCVDALHGAPGVRSKRYSGQASLCRSDLDRRNNDLLLRELSGAPARPRSAQFVCAAAVIASGRGEATFEGSCEGVIVHELKGSGGFGYDPIFLVPSEGLTFAELAETRKNQISHRALAWQQAFAHIAKWG